MPEGDTIHRAAQSLRRVLLDRPIRSAQSPRELVDAESLAGRRVTGIESRGKHLLTFLDDERVLHSHMGMTGSWHIYPAGTTYNKPRKWAALELLLDEHAVVCFSPRQFELLSPAQFRRHELLRRLGPDLLAGEIDWEEVQRRFRTHPATALGEAILNQTIVCGAGNVYKSEVLFLCGLSPFRTVASVDDERLLNLLKRCRALMLRNLEGFPRRTRFGGTGGRLWVYDRAGEDCLKCGHTVEMRRQGDLGRSTYYCPVCQPLEPGKR